MLNMSSVPDAAQGAATTADPDRTARARIRDAAIVRFAEDGVDATSIRAVAAEAGVSPALVIHHFGSKDDLRVACDEHVAASVREQKRAVLGAGVGMDPLAALRANQQGPPLLRYLARTLVDGSPHVAELVDEMVADAVEYMEEGVAAGTLVPSERPRARATVLTIWSLGALVLHEHLGRLLGADLVGDPEGLGPYVRPAAEILTAGVLPEALLRQVEDAFPDAPEPPDREPPATDSHESGPLESVPHDPQEVGA
jgi:AcrR family transcriptional regulator